MSKAKENESAGFEARLSRLEAISDQMRRGDIDLEVATTLFEEGILLAKGLEKDLARIERRIEIVVNETAGENEKPVLELFPELGE